MIYVNISGGLGNQLFEYAYAREIQNSTGQDIELNIHEIVNYEQNRKFALSHYELPDTVHIGEKALPWYAHRRSIRGAVMRRLSPELMRYYGIRHNSHIWYESAYREYPALDTNQDIYLGGYWQSPRYSQAVRYELCRSLMIREQIPPDIVRLREQIVSSIAICMHVRRDDYVGSDYEVCTDQYYQHAMQAAEKELSGQEICYYVFSDDPVWAEQNIKSQHRMVYMKGHKDYEDLYLMSGCRHFILSNSSYSWWAQELSTCREKLVFAPAIWHHKWNNPDIYEENWILIQTD